MTGPSLQPIPGHAKKEALCEAITRAARRMGPGRQLPTFRELCRDLKVAKVTLDNALRELESRRVVVRRHGRGIFVSPDIGLRNVGAVMGCDFTTAGYSPFWALLLQTAQQAGTDRNYRVYSYLDTVQGAGQLPTHHQLQDDIRRGRLDGLLLLLHGSMNDHAWMGESPVPVVSISSLSATPYQARLDGEEACRLGLQGLKAAGCRTVGLMGMTGEALETFFLERCAALGLECRPAGLLTYHRWVGRMPGPSTRENFAYSVLERLLQQGEADGAGRGGLPEGLLVLDDTMARGAIQALGQHGLRVDRDIKMASTCNVGSPVLTPFEASLILVEHDPGELVGAALDLLGALMDGREPDPPCVVVKPRLRLP